MKNLIYLYFVLFAATAFSQPLTQLNPDGFTAVEFARPNRTNEKLLELSKAWAADYNKDGFDVYDVTENSVSIDGFRKNAFFYRNVGESFYHNITYSINVTFQDKVCTILFSVKDIYAKKTLLTTTVAEYFTTDGKLKEDMDDVKPSLESTANKILKSYISFISSN